MKKLNCLPVVTSLALLAATSLTAHAQDWPTRPIKAVTTGTGGGLDVGLRVLATVVGPALGQPMVVENRPTRPELTLLNSPADGHTLLYWSNPLWLAPFMEDVNYDPIKDFAPVSITHSSPNVLLVNAAVPVRTVQELVDLAKAKPKELNIGLSTVLSGSNSLAALLFFSVTKVEMTEVRYKETSATINDLLAGRVQVGFPGVTAVLPHAKTGKLRVLAVTGTKPSSQLPDAPALATIYPEFDVVSVNAMLVKAGTPRAIIARLNQAVVKAVHLPEISQKLLGVGLEPVGSTPEQLAAFIMTDMKKTGAVIKEKGIKSSN